GRRLCSARTMMRPFPNLRPLVCATVLVALVTASACGGAPGGRNPAVGVGPTGEAGVGGFTKIDAERVAKLRSGASLPLVAGWFVKERPDGLVLEEPDRELTVTLLEIPADDGEVAVGKAFAALGRDAPATVEKQTRENELAGWD